MTTVFQYCLYIAAVIFSIFMLSYAVKDIINDVATDCTVYGKSLNKKISEINWAISKLDDKKYFKFSNKGENFTIHISDDEIKSSCFHYHCTPVYTCKNIFINDELVCKLHKLNGTCFTKYYSAEFSRDRNQYEVIELIDIAYKAAKKFEKKYWADRAANNYGDDDKSFYKKEG